MAPKVIGVRADPDSRFFRPHRSICDRQLALPLSNPSNPGEAISHPYAGEEFWANGTELHSVKAAARQGSSTRSHHTENTEITDHNLRYWQRIWLGSENLVLKCQEPASNRSSEMPIGLASEEESRGGTIERRGVSRIPSGGWW